MSCFHLSLWTKPASFLRDVRVSVLGEESWKPTQAVFWTILSERSGNKDCALLPPEAVASAAGDRPSRALLLICFGGFWVTLAI